MNNTKIPKVINYCLFGGNKKNKVAEKCIQSWKKNCPDYEFIEWNENNFDVNMNNYGLFKMISIRFNLLINVMRCREK